MSSPITTYYSPIHIKYIVDSVEDYDEDLYAYILDYCAEKGYLFSMREFDSWTHSEDRDLITQLPAIHVYINKIHSITTYPNGDPFEQIDTCVQKYNKMKEEWRAWAPNIQKYKNALKGLLKLTSQPSSPVEEQGDEQVNPMHS